MSITVTTNNHRRPIIDARELTPREREEFDYIDWSQIEHGFESASFFRYRGQLYDLSEFIESAPDGVNGFDAFRADSFFSGIAIRIVTDADTYDYSVVVALVLA